MKKLFLFAMVLSASFLIIGPSTSIDGILLKYYHDPDLLSNNETVNNIIIIPKESFNKEDVSLIIRRIENLPSSLLNKIDQAGIKIKLFTGKLTDNRIASYLKGVVPKGYATGKTWDEVPGMGGKKIVFVKIGRSDKGMGHGSVNLELHELAHSVDRHVFQGIRFNPLFLSIWEKEKDHLFPNNKYMTVYPEEYFAECFALYYLSEETRSQLKKGAPETYEFIGTLK